MPDEEIPPRPSPEHWWGRRSQRWHAPIRGFTAKEWLPPAAFGIRDNYTHGPVFMPGAAAPNYFTKQLELGEEPLLEVPEADG